MSNLIVKEVSFNDVALIGIQKDSKVFVGLRKICDDLGIDFSGQLKKIKDSTMLSKGMEEITIPTNGGQQAIICLNIDYLPIYLSGIKEKKCKESVRPFLIEFQLKAKDVLANAFLNNPAHAPALSPEELALASAQNIVNLRKELNEVKSIVNVMVQEKNTAIDTLKYLEEPKVLPLQKSDRSAVNQLVRTYAVSINKTAQAVWNVLYNEFLYTYHMNIKERAKSLNISTLDYLESIGKIPDLYALAYKMFVGQKSKV